MKKLGGPSVKFRVPPAAGFSCSTAGAGSDGRRSEAPELNGAASGPAAGRSQKEHGSGAERYLAPAVGPLAARWPVTPFWPCLAEKSRVRVAPEARCRGVVAPPPTPAGHGLKACGWLKARVWFMACYQFSGGAQFGRIWRARLPPTGPPLSPRAPEILAATRGPEGVAGPPPLLQS